MVETNNSFETEVSVTTRNDDVFNWNGLPSEIQNLITEYHVAGRSEHFFELLPCLPPFSAVNQALRSHALALLYTEQTVIIAIQIRLNGEGSGEFDEEIAKYNSVRQSTYTIQTELYDRGGHWRMPNFEELTMLEHVMNLHIDVFDESGEGTTAIDESQ